MMGFENALSTEKNGKEHGKMKLRRFAYILAAFVLFLLVTYVIFTWGRLQ